MAENPHSFPPGMEVFGELLTIKQGPLEELAQAILDGRVHVNPHRDYAERIDSWTIYVDPPPNPQEPTSG